MITREKNQKGSDSEKNEKMLPMPSRTAMIIGDGSIDLAFAVVGANAFLCAAIPLAEKLPENLRIPIAIAAQIGILASIVVGEYSFTFNKGRYRSIVVGIEYKIDNELKKLLRKG